MKDTAASEQIDDIIKSYGSWKGELLSHLRAVITSADPDVVEEIKWRMATRPEGLPVWTHDGILCFAETWKDNIKLIFSKGAQMESLQRHFNARLKSSAIRAIEFHEGDAVNETAIKALVQEAVRLNTLKASK